MIILKNVQSPYSTSPAKAGNNGSMTYTLKVYLFCTAILILLNKALEI